jgi:hypothetical protein
MPLGVERRDVVLHDGACAAAALGREHVKVVVLAVRLAVLLVEAALAELLAALRAEEVLRVPRLLQRRHAFLSKFNMQKTTIFLSVWKIGFARSYVENGPVAVGAARRKQIVVVGLAVGRAVALKEVARAQLGVALLASEVLRVPGLAQRRDHLNFRG